MRLSIDGAGVNCVRKEFYPSSSVGKTALEAHTGTGALGDLGVIFGEFVAESGVRGSNTRLIWT